MRISPCNHVLSLLRIHFRYLPVFPVIEHAVFHFAGTYLIFIAQKLCDLEG